MKGYLIHQKAINLLIVFSVLLILIMGTLFFIENIELIICFSLILLITNIIILIVLIVKKEKYFKKIYIFDDKLEIRYKEKIYNQIFYQNIKNVRCFYGTDKLLYMEIKYIEDNEIKTISFDLLKVIEDALFNKNILINYDV